MGGTAVRREKSKKKLGRKQYALTILSRLALLLGLNIVLNVAPLFPFQGRRVMEEGAGISPTHVIWEETAHKGKWDGDYRYLAANEDTAVFSRMRFHWGYGWESSFTYLMNQHTPDPIHAKWIREYGSGRGGYNFFYLVGYVASDQVASVEYQIDWEDYSESTIVIAEEDYIYEDGKRYYVYDGCDYVRQFSEEDIQSSFIYDITAIARDARGEILYQRSIYHDLP